MDTATKECEYISVDLLDNGKKILLGINESIAIYVKSPYHSDRSGVSPPLNVSVILEKI